METRGGDGVRFTLLFELLLEYVRVYVPGRLGGRLNGTILLRLGFLRPGLFGRLRLGLLFELDLLWFRLGLGLVIYITQ